MKKRIWTILGWAYMFTGYVTGYLLIKISGLILVLGCLLMLEKRKAIDTLKRVLKW